MPPQPPDTRVDPSAVASACFLFPSMDEATKDKSGGGSAFLFGVYDEALRDNFPYIVTARHVVENGCTMIARRPRLTGDPPGSDPNFYYFEVPESAWHFDPDGYDLAVALLNDEDGRPPPPLNGNNVWLLTEEQVESGKIGLGDPGCTIGRFQHHPGHSLNAPVVRFGHIAQMPGEDLEVPVAEPRPGFLVEMGSLSAYAGSPVFWYGHNDRPGRAPTGRILGVEYGHVGTHQQPFMGLAAVVPGWRLRCLLLDRKPVVAERLATRSAE